MAEVEDLQRLEVTDNNVLTAHKYLLLVMYNKVSYLFIHISLRCVMEF